MESLGICSWVQGELYIHDGVSTLEPLGCLQRVDSFVALVETSASDLSGLSALHESYGLAVIGNSQLTTINLPTLETVDEFYVSDNPVLVSLDLPNLIQMVWMDVYNNPLLPECQLEALQEQANPMGVMCAGNHGGLCAGFCG